MFTDAAFIGIALPAGAGSGLAHFAALDRNLRVTAQRAGPLDDALTFSLTFPSAFVAVSTPQAPNLGLMGVPEWRQRFGLPPNSRRWIRFRVCEYELRQRGLLFHGNTPGGPEASPPWIRASFQCCDHLRAEGFAPYRRVGEHSPRQLLEAHPFASCAVLLGHPPFRKTTLEGRLQRQLLLYREGVDVPDAMEVFEEITRHHLLSGQLRLDGLLTPEQLGALTVAYTAFLAALQPNRIVLVGDPVEGQIVLPTGELKDRYRSPA